MQSPPFGFNKEYFQWLTTEYAVPFVINLVLAIIVFLIGKAIAKMVTKIFTKLLNKANVDETLARFLSNIIYGILLAVVIIFALEQLGIQTTAAVAILGAAGLAIGFALKDSLGNFASGVMVMLFRPFKAGDTVKAGGQFGKIKEVQTFATIMTTFDGKEVIIPNGKITGDVIENWTSQGTLRVDMVFGIGYADDIDKAKEIIERLVTGHDKTLADPAPLIAVAELADSSVNIVCRPWVNTADYWTVHYDMHEAVKKEFDASGISIPFPQQDVHLHKVA